MGPLGLLYAKGKGHMTHMTSYDICGAPVVSKLQEKDASKYSLRFLQLMPSPWGMRGSRENGLGWPWGTRSSQCLANIPCTRYAFSETCNRATAPSKPFIHRYLHFTIPSSHQTQSAGVFRQVQRPGNTVTHQRSCLMPVCTFAGSQAGTKPS